MANNHDDMPEIQDGSDTGSDAGSEAGAIVPVILTPWQMYAPYFADEVVALRDAMHEKAFKPCCICGKAGPEVFKYVFNCGNPAHTLCQGCNIDRKLVNGSKRVGSSARNQVMKHNMCPYEGCLKELPPLGSCKRMDTHAWKMDVCQAQTDALKMLREQKEAFEKLHVEMYLRQKQEKENAVTRHQKEIENAKRGRTNPGLTVAKLADAIVAQMRQQHEADSTMPALPAGFDGKALAKLYKDKSLHAALEQQQPESEALRLFMARWATDAPGKKAAANKVAKLEQERINATARETEHQLAAAVTALQAEQLRANMLNQEIRNLRAEMEGVRRGAGGSGDAHGSDGAALAAADRQIDSLIHELSRATADQMALERHVDRLCAQLREDHGNLEYEFGRAEGFLGRCAELNGQLELAHDEIEHKDGRIAALCETAATSAVELARLRAELEAAQAPALLAVVADVVPPAAMPSPRMEPEPAVMEVEADTPVDDDREIRARAAEARVAEPVPFNSAALDAEAGASQA